MKKTVISFPNFLRESIDTARKEKNQTLNEFINECVERYFFYNPENTTTAICECGLLAYWNPHDSMFKCDSCMSHYFIEDE